MSESLTDWIDKLFQQRELLLMGHAQRQLDSNLGMGWLYYALARVIRPSTAIVIGSYRGFVPMVLARALADNSEGGQVHFIDPSFVDDFWTVESNVQDYFAGHGVSNISHYLMTMQEFISTDAYRQLDQVGMVFIDGYHTAEQAHFDFEAFADKLSPTGMVLLHDSLWRKKSLIYGAGREYETSVVDCIAELKRQPAWQLLDLPFGDGLTILRRAATPCESRRDPFHEAAERLRHPSPANPAHTLVHPSMSAC